MPSLPSVCFPQARAPSAPAEPATAAAAAAAAPVKKAAPRPSRLRKAAAVPAQRRVAAAAAAAEELDFAARGDAEKTAAGAATAEGGAAGGAAASGGGDAEELAGRDALTLVPARTRRGRPKVGDCVPNARTHSFMFTPGGMLVAEGAAGNGYRSPRDSDVFLQVQLSTTLTRHYRGGAGVVLGGCIRFQHLGFRAKGALQTVYSSSSAGIILRVSGRYNFLLITDCRFLETVSDK